MDFRVHVGWHSASQGTPACPGPLGCSRDVGLSPFGEAGDLGLALAQPLSC